jgi:hypothetical protein
MVLVPDVTSGDLMGRWHRGERTVEFLISRGRLEILKAADLSAAAASVLGRATRRLEITARMAFVLGDLEGAYATAYDAYRMAAESLLARQGLRVTGGDGSHMAVQDAVSAQFAAEIQAFARPTFERLRTTRHAVQYFDPTSASVTESDTRWAVEKASDAVEGATALLSRSQLERWT